MTVYIVKVVIYTQKFLEKLKTEVVIILDSIFTQKNDGIFLYSLITLYKKYRVFTS